MLDPDHVEKLLDLPAVNEWGLPLGRSDYTSGSIEAEANLLLHVLISFGEQLEALRKRLDTQEIPCENRS